jgi:microcystin-dependent protein
LRNLNNKVDNSNTPAGLLPAIEWNDTVSEIINVITDTQGGNVALNPSVTTQLLTSIQRIATLALKSVGLKSEISQPVSVVSSVPQINTINTSGFYSIPVGGVAGTGGSFPIGWDFSRATSSIFHLSGVSTNLNGFQVIGQKVGVNNTKLWFRAESTTNNSWDNWVSIISSSDLQSIGLFSTTVATAIADANTSFNAGLYRANSGTTNMPFAGNWTGIRLVGSSSLDWVDIAVNLNIESSMYFRRKTSIGFGSWFQIATQTDLDAVRPFTGKVEMTSGAVLPSGYLWADGAAVSRATYPELFALYVTSQGFTTQTFTVNIANPATFTSAVPHGFVGGERLRLSTTGSLPTGLTSGGEYFVRVLSTTTFNLYNRATNDLVITSSSQSGVHSYTQTLYGLGDGSTTFNVPDYRGLSLLGASSTFGLGSFTEGSIPVSGWGSFGSGSAGFGNVLSGTGAGEAGEFLESIGSARISPRAGITPRGLGVNYIIKT